MHISEEYRERYDRLALVHPWMREMRDEEPYISNMVIDGEDYIVIPAGYVTESTTEINIGEKRFVLAPTNGIDGETNGIADEITLPEDDAVSALRMYASFWNLKNYLQVPHCDNWESKTMKLIADMVERDYVHRDDAACAKRAEIRRLEAERDEWRDKAEQAHETMDRMQEVIDGYEDSTTDLEMEISELKVKSAKRAAAAERLKNARYHTLADYVRAMLGWGHEPHFEDCRDALIDLLTDDNGGSSKVKAGLSERAAAAERLRGMTLSTGSAVKKLAIALDVNWNPDNAPLSMSKLQNKLIDLLTDDESCRQDADQGEYEESHDCESDSREKLEADLQALTERWHDYDGNFMRIYSTVAYAQVKELLDRQAAITHSIDAWNIKRLQQQLKVAQDVNERQDIEYLRQCEKIAELQEKVDTLSHENAKLSSDELTARTACDYWRGQFEAIRSRHRLLKEQLAAVLNES